MSYTENASIVSRISDGLARMMAVVVVAYRGFGLKVSESNTRVHTLVVGAPHRGDRSAHKPGQSTE